MQIHLANCNLTHPPLQHLPVDESPRGEEMKSVNILQCCHTMFAESAKERRNAFCQYPHTVQYNWFKKLLAHAMQTSRRKEEWGGDTKEQVGIFATLSSWNPQYFHLTPRQKAQKLLSVCQWMGNITGSRVVKSFICVKILVWPTLLACTSQVWVERWQSR